MSNRRGPRNGLSARKAISRRRRPVHRQRPLLGEWLEPRMLLATALNDSFPAVEDTPLVVATPGVLANDTGSGPLSTVLDSGTVHGSIVLNYAGGFTYTPDPDFNGPDSFVYHA